MNLDGIHAPSSIAQLNRLLGHLAAQDSPERLGARPEWVDGERPAERAGLGQRARNLVSLRRRRAHARREIVVRLGPCEFSQNRRQPFGPAWSKRRLWQEVHVTPRRAILVTASAEGPNQK